MSSDRGNEGNPLQGLLADLLKVVGGAPGGTTPWLEAARALAHGVATDGAPEANIDPIRRIELAELARVVEMHVAETTGLPLAHGGQRPPTFEPVSPGAWALRALEAWRPLVEPIVNGGGGSPGLGQLGSVLGADGGGGGLQDLLDQFAVTMGPVLFGMQLGSAVGHLAKRAMGQFALPVPWPASPELLIVPDNVTAFGDDWSLPAAETRLWVCIRELTMSAVMSQPEVDRRLRTLIDQAMRMAVDAQQGLTDRLGAHAGDPEALQSLLSDPESMLADSSRARSARRVGPSDCADDGHRWLRRPCHRQDRPEPRGIPTPLLGEAWFRHCVEDNDGQRAAGALFGLDLGREETERGAAFVRGVVERAGEERPCAVVGGSTQPADASRGRRARTLARTNQPARASRRRRGARRLRPLLRVSPRSPQGNRDPSPAPGFHVRHPVLPARGYAGTVDRAAAGAPVAPRPGP